MNHLFKTSICEWSNLRCKCVAQCCFQLVFTERAQGLINQACPLNWGKSMRASTHIIKKCIQWWISALFSSIYGQIHSIWPTKTLKYNCTYCRFGSSKLSDRIFLFGLLCSIYSLRLASSSFRRQLLFRSFLLCDETFKLLGWGILTIGPRVSNTFINIWYLIFFFLKRGKLKKFIGKPVKWLA